MVLRFKRLALCWSFVHIAVGLQLQQQPLIPGLHASNACQNAVGQLIGLHDLSDMLVVLLVVEDFWRKDSLPEYSGGI
jgi:hypothetical protein